MVVFTDDEEIGICSCHHKSAKINLVHKESKKGGSNVKSETVEISPVGDLKAGRSLLAMCTAFSLKSLSPVKE